MNGLNWLRHTKRFTNARRSFIAKPSQEGNISIPEDAVWIKIIKEDGFLLSLIVIVVEKDHPTADISICFMNGFGPS